jgi:cytochrome c5
MKLAIASACLFLVPLGLVAWPARQTTEPARHAPGGSSKTHADAGERAFAANCSRCHAAPMSLPPRITGTVIMHMRTRARLSRQDEQALLKYLAP